MTFRVSPENRATGQPVKTVTARRRFHPIPVVVSPRHRRGHTNGLLVLPRHRRGASKRLSFCPHMAVPTRNGQPAHPHTAVAGRHDQPFHPATAVAARNDRRFGRTRPWQAKNTVVFIKNRRFCPFSFLTMEFHSHFINTGLQPGACGCNALRAASAALTHCGKPLKRLLSSAPFTTGLKPGANERSNRKCKIFLLTPIY